MPLDLTIKTGDLEKWADALESAKAADLASRILRQVKRRAEVDRFNARTKFTRVRRLKSGAKRFAATRSSQQDKAQPIPESFAAQFTDIFK